MLPRLSLALALLLSLSISNAQTTQPSRPNVIIILADDMGFSDPGCFGGEIRTPAIDSLAKDGVRVSQFYNMARCCPTRASILTGLYPHQAGVGAMNQNLGRPAYQGHLNSNSVTIAEVLRAAGYHTAMVGKWHLSELSIATLPNDQAKAALNHQLEVPISPDKSTWPTHRGFEEHWGTIPGVDDYFDPYGLVHNDQPITPDLTNFYYTDFITDHAVDLIHQYAAQPAQPFFMYVAYTAPHWPMQAREDDITPYEEIYKVGWDKIREARFARQVQMGLAKPEWTLSPRAFNKALNDGPSAVGPWDEASDKPWQARRMATYAAMIESMDRGIGKILAQLKATGADQNTLILFLSDNGACQENVQPGWYDVPSQTRTGVTIHVGNNPAHLPGPQTVYQSYGPAWANASNTPFRRFKHFTEEGGISAPFIARWPAASLQPGRLETQQLGHVIDLMPTILAATAAIYPATFNNNPITPPEGQSLLPLLTTTPATEPARDPAPRTLCWEHEGNRAVRIGDWKLVGPHNEPWRLYNIPADRTELHDLSKDHPEKVAELAAAYEAWAKRCQVEPWPVK